MGDNPSMPNLLDAIGDCASYCQFEADNPLKTELAPILYKRVILEGIVSAGKTTEGEELTNFLVNHVGVRAKFIPEQFNPEMLALFYEEMRKVKLGLKKTNEAAFPLQLQMLHLRQLNYEKALAYTGQGELACSSPHTIFEDRSVARLRLRFLCLLVRFVWGDSVFASLQRAGGNISAEQFSVYLSALSKFKYGPAIIVFLDVTAAEAYRRKNERARKEEDTVPQDYLHSLRLGYYLMLRTLSAKTKVKILLLRNNMRHPPLYILRRIARCPPPEVTRDLIWKRYDPLTSDATEQELDAAFEKLHQVYDAYEETH